MKQVITGNIIQDEFTVTRTSKNTYRIISHDNKHYVKHSKRDVFEFMDKQGIFSFEITE